MGTGNGEFADLNARIIQASGMVSVQAECSPSEALVLMKKAADAGEATLDEVATDVILRRVRFGE